MLIQEPKVEYWEQKNPYEHVAKAASVCYQSKLKEGEAAKKFYNALVHSGHVSMLRHESCYYLVNRTCTNGGVWGIIGMFTNNPYINIKYDFFNDNSKYYTYISTNANFLLDHKDFAELLEPFKATPEEFKKECPELMRYTFHITTSIDISREFNRVSPNNISEESTRYCNYSKDKFGSEINIGNSVEFDLENISKNSTEHILESVANGKSLTYYQEDALFKAVFEFSEAIYMSLLEHGVKPEFARKVLPLSTKTEVIYTYSVKEWEAILQKRLLNLTGKAHPDAVEVAELIYDELQKLGYKLNDENELIYASV